jgi:hypothetical protein
LEVLTTKSALWVPKSQKWILLPCLGRLSPERSTKITYAITKQTTHNEMHTKILLGTCEMKISLQRHNHTWEDIISCEDVDWIQQAKDKVQWRTLLNVIKTLLFHIKKGISQLAEQLLASLDGLWYIEFFLKLHNLIISLCA